MLGKFLKESLLWFYWSIYNDVYTGEIDDYQLSGMATLKNVDFNAGLTYYYAEPIGPDVTSPGKRLYVIRTVVVNPNNLVEEARVFSERVKQGKALQSATAPPTTTTTTAAPVTTTTTVAATTTTTTAAPTTTTTTI